MAKRQLDLARKEQPFTTRLNVDITSDESEALQDWCRALGKQVRKPRIPATKVIRAMLKRIENDPEWKARIAEDVLNGTD